MFFFFFSSRRRHTRFDCDWSSDVCSSDLAEIAGAENEALLGREVEVLVAEGEGRKDAATHRASGRARDNRLVHFAPSGTEPRPGDVVTTAVTQAAPHYLIADAPPRAVRRTR